MTAAPDAVEAGLVARKPGEERVRCPGAPTATRGRMQSPHYRAIR